MVIYSNNFKIESINNKVYYNYNEIKFNTYFELYSIMLKYINRKKTDDIYLEGEYEPLNDIEQVILLILSNKYGKVFSIKYNKYLDITFSYNFKIFDQKWIIDRILKIGKRAFSSNMIVLGDSIDYLEKDVSNKQQYKMFYSKYGYIIRRGDSFFDIRTSNLLSTLEYWNNYCIRKHGTHFSNETLDVYEDIYSTLGFNSIKLICKDEIVASSVFFVDIINKKLYFCILGWNEKYKNFSPGIYLYCKGIEFCNKMNYKFSFCYGLQEYKRRMLNCFYEKDQKVN